MSSTNEPACIFFNAGVASAITLAERAADIVAAGDGMAGPRDPVTVEALRTFAQEAANLLKPLPVADEEA